MDSEDKEIIEGFVVEGLEMLDDIEPDVLALGNYTGEAREALPGNLLNSIFRIFHTLKGSAGYLNLTNISLLCHSVETLLDIFRKGKSKANHQHIRILCSAIDLLRILILSVQKTNSDEGHQPEADHLIGNIDLAIQGEPFSPIPLLEKTEQEKEDEGKNNLPEKESGSLPELEFNITQEMRDSFINESDELLDTLEELLLDLEANPGNKETILHLFRKIHSFKGNAGFFGHQDLEKLAHSTENLLAAVKEGRMEINQPIIVLLLNVKDTLKTCIANISKKENGNIGELKLMVNSLQNFTPEPETHHQGPEKNEKSDEDNQDKNHPNEKMKVETLILVVEDEPLQCDILCKMLHSAGYPTVTAINGKEALNSLQKHKISLCITDILMPLMGGQALCEKLNKSYPLLPVILSSGRADKKIISEFLHLTIDGLIEKPYRLEDVLAKVQAALAAADKRTKEHSLTTYSSNITSPKNKLKNFIRVDMTKLDKLMNLVGELIIAEEMVVKNRDIRNIEKENFDRSAEHLHRISSELQDVSMSVRMVPVQPLFRKMVRLIHDLSAKFNKKIKLELAGEDTEIDKIVLDQISDPLIHLLRNAADHGIETGPERKLAGKNPVGTITLTAIQKTSEIWIIIRDDGRGLDKKKILAKAGKEGLVEKISDLTDQQVYNLIFKPGFSTAKKITSVSGRGVGMDVVKKNIEKIKGRIEIQNQPGNGSEFIIRIPLTLAVIEGMLIQVGSSKFTIAITSIKESISIDKSQITITPEGDEMVKIRDDIFPVYRLHKMHKIDTEITELDKGILMVLEVNSHVFCLFVDKILNQIETVIKPLSNYIGHVNGVSGCNILGDGEISLILDVEKLAERREYVNAG